jgi:hypothetical protein
MKKETVKKQIQKHLWAWGYNVIDMARMGLGMNWDLAVKVNKDSSKVYKVKVITDEDLSKELSNVKSCIESNEECGSVYNVLAMVSGGKKKYAGGAQTDPLFTTKHKEVFK